jgi:hypothetical protein
MEQSYEESAYASRVPHPVAPHMPFPTVHNAWRSEDPMTKIQQLYQNPFSPTAHLNQPTNIPGHLSLQSSPQPTPNHTYTTTSNASTPLPTSHIASPRFHYSGEENIVTPDQESSFWQRSNQISDTPNSLLTLMVLGEPRASDQLDTATVDTDESGEEVTKEKSENLANAFLERSAKQIFVMLWALCPVSFSEFLRTKCTMDSRLYPFVETLCDKVRFFFAMDFFFAFQWKCVFYSLQK